MGRGRQKAKNTKIARDIKYSIQDTNFEDLQRELARNNRAADNSDQWGSSDYDDLADKYNSEYDLDDDEDDEDES